MLRDRESIDSKMLFLMGFINLVGQDIQYIQKQRNVQGVLRS